MKAMEWVRPGAVVMLIDTTGNIPTEGPATVDCEPDEFGMLAVTILRKYREAGDVDGLREVSITQVFLASEYRDPCPGGIHAPITEAIYKKAFGYCCKRCNRVVL